MTAPLRMIDDPDVRPDVRDVVRNVRAAHPDYDVARGMARFNATLRATPATATAKSAGLPLAAKLLAAVAFLGVGLAAAYKIAASPPPPPIEAPPPLPPIATPTKEPELPPSAADVPSVSVDALPFAPAPPASALAARPPAREVPSDREREVRHLVELQRIAASDPAGAIALAKAGHAEFPRGALLPEREIILVDSLVRDGQTREARDRATAFVKAYPKSPAAPHMRAIADDDAP